MVVRSRSPVLAALSARVSNGLTLSSGVTIVPRDVLFSGAVFGAGDVVAQRLKPSRSADAEHEGEGAGAGDALVSVRDAHVDVPRVLSAAVLGMLYGGGFLPVVYQLAEKAAPGTGAREVLVKAAGVTAVCSSLGNYVSMLWRRSFAPAEAPGECAAALLEHVSPPFSTTTYPSLRRRSLRERLVRCSRSVNRDFPEVFVTDWCFWPLYDALNFRVIPPWLRPLTTTVVSTLWHTYVSVTAARPSVAMIERALSGNEKDTS